MKKAIPVLEKYIRIIESGKYNPNHILPRMVNELYEKETFSNLYPLHLLVRKVVMDTIKFNENYEGYPISEDRMQWILRDFEDLVFDYDNFKKQVIEVMESVECNYKK